MASFLQRSVSLLSHVFACRDKLGLNVIDVKADHELADCVFVEDPLIAIEKKALFTTLGHPSRQPEVSTCSRILLSFMLTYGLQSTALIRRRLTSREQFVLLLPYFLNLNRRKPNLLIAD